MAKAETKVIDVPAPIDPASLGCLTSSNLADNAFARVLLLGPPKAGKTTALATAPKPLLINCDGPNAPKGAAHYAGQEFLVLDAYTSTSFKKAIDAAYKLAAAGVVQSVILDTLTLLADNVLDELKVKGFSGFDLWNEFDSAVRGGLKRLLAIDAHVFISAHMDAGHDEGAGIMPLFPGQGKRKIAGMIDDWILLDCVAGRNPMRQFILTPQGEWKGDCRNIKRLDVCEATVPALFAALGIAA